MSNIFEDDITLPGVITHVEADYSFGYDTSLFGTTDSEIIIGTAFHGPVGVLTPVYSHMTARSAKKLRWLRASRMLGIVAAARFMLAVSAVSTCTRISI